VSDISRDALNAVFTHSGSRPAPFTSSRKLMGGTATITILGGGSDLLESCWALLDNVEVQWSRFLPDSDITRLNWAEGQTCEVNPRTVRLIEEMQEGSRRTNGDFDPTLLPDVVRAGYAASLVDPKHTTALPASARAPGDIFGVKIDGNNVTLPLGTTLDPGGIGKGLAADLVAEFALSNGAWGIMAEIAGDIRVAGESPDGIAWRLGVENPFSGDEHVDVIRLPDGGVVTSSQRKRRFGDGDHKHHLIDPRMGDSASTDVQTVTVIAATASKAETLTKPGFVRPVADYLAWLPSVGAAGMVVVADGSQHETENWGRYR
jgi:thiamine biosynthesis lipoprotein